MDARPIRRYANRKLYDVSSSRYITLEEIGAMVRAGETVHVVDHETERDLTCPVLAKVLMEDERLTAATMHTMVRLGAMDSDIGTEDYEELAARVAELETLITRHFQE